MTPELLLALVSGKSVGLAEPVGGRVPEWTLVEAGFGMAGLGRTYELAFRYRHARDFAVYPRLWRALHRETARIAWTDRWKQHICGRNYLDDLIHVVLTEEWLSYCDRQRLLDRLERSWPDGVYIRDVLPKQRQAGMILDRWCSTAHEHVARRIRQDVDYDESVDADIAIA